MITDIKPDIIKRYTNFSDIDKDNLIKFLCIKTIYDTASKYGRFPSDDELLDLLDYAYASWLNCDSYESADYFAEVLSDAYYSKRIDMEQIWNLGKADIIEYCLDYNFYSPEKEVCC